MLLPDKRCCMFAVQRSCIVSGLVGVRLLGTQTGSLTQYYTTIVDGRRAGVSRSSISQYLLTYYLLDRMAKLRRTQQFMHEPDHQAISPRKWLGTLQAKLFLTG